MQGETGGLFGDSAPAAPTTLDMAGDHSVFRQTAQNGHPDFRLLARTPNPNTGRMRKEIVIEDVRGIIDFLRECGMQVRTGSLVTDAGSTKVEIHRVAREYLREDVIFVGGHPIAGSEHSGLGYSDGNLFRDAAYALIHEGEQNEGAHEFHG